MSKLSERRYRRKGLDENQQQIVGAFESLGIDGVSILEIGCGVGELHQTLLGKGAATACTRGTIALTYPRNHFFSRLSKHLWNFGLWLFRSDFRGFVHDPDLVQQSIEKRGFQRVFNHDSPMWHTQVYTIN